MVRHVEESTNSTRWLHRVSKIFAYFRSTSEAAGWSYLQYHFTCDWLFHSRMSISFFELPGSERRSSITRRNGRASSSRTAKGGGLPGGVKRPATWPRMQTQGSMPTT